MRVRDIMHRNVVTVEEGLTCADAAKLLRQHEISSLIVNGPAGPTGIITEHDFAILVADGKNPGSTTVGERMTRDVITVASDAEVADAAQIMVERHIRHLPVVDPGRLVGVISIRDPVVRHPALHRYEEARRRSLQAQVADQITRIAGSMPFVYLHAVWFVLWMCWPWSRFPTAC